MKENVIIGKLIPAGTGMKRYRNIKLDTDDRQTAEPEIDGEADDDVVEENTFEEAMESAKAAEAEIEEELAAASDTGEE
jgi:DNA-directed RNA polymerase subunit beta'